MKTIIKKMPNDARNNLAKLERGLERKAARERKVMQDYKALKTIWREEGIDAALSTAPHMGIKKHDAFKLIEMWAFPKQFAERVELEQRGRENDGLNRCS